MKHLNRHSIRLAGYDYSQAGVYFITICTQNRECLFGDIVNGSMILNDAGIIVQEEWTRAKIVRPYVTLDAFVVMPNHIHGIIVFTDTGRGTSVTCPDLKITHPTLKTTQLGESQGTQPVTTRDTPPQSGTPPACPYERGFGGAVAHSLSTVTGQFKSITTKRLNGKWGVSGTKIWQRNYYEHIIRNDEALNRIRGYIIGNPQQWEKDCENPIRPAIASRVEQKTFHV